MRTNGLFFGVGLALGLFAAAGPAAADIPPPGLCRSDEVGAVCDEAVDKNGKELGEAGICVAEQCTRGTPNGPMTYACVMCRLEATDPNAGGAGGGANYPAEPSAGAASQPTEPATGGSGSSPTKPTAGSGGQTNPAKGGSSSTAGKATQDAAGEDDGGCSIGLGKHPSGIVTVSSLIALGLVLGRRRWQRRA